MDKVPYVNFPLCLLSTFDLKVISAYALTDLALRRCKKMKVQNKEINFTISGLDGNNYADKSRREIADELKQKDFFINDIDLNKTVICYSQKDLTLDLIRGVISFIFTTKEKEYNLEYLLESCKFKDLNDLMDNLIKANKLVREFISKYYDDAFCHVKLETLLETCNNKFDIKKFRVLAAVTSSIGKKKTHVMIRKSLIRVRAFGCKSIKIFEEIGYKGAFAILSDNCIGKITNRLKDEGCFEKYFIHRDCYFSTRLNHSELIDVVHNKIKNKVKKKKGTTDFDKYKRQELSAQLKALVEKSEQVPELVKRQENIPKLETLEIPLPTNIPLSDIYDVYSDGKKIATLTERNFFKNFTGKNYRDRISKMQYYKIRGKIFVGESISNLQNIELRN